MSSSYTPQDTKPLFLTEPIQVCQWAHAVRDLLGSKVLKGWKVIAFGQYKDTTGYQHEYAVFKIVQDNCDQEPPIYLCIEWNAQDSAKSPILVLGRGKGSEALDTILRMDWQQLQACGLPIEPFIIFTPSIPLYKLALLSEVIHSFHLKYSSSLIISFGMQTY